MADRTCDVCGYIFAYPYNLRRHKLRQTYCGELSIAPVNMHNTCETCGRKFATPYTLLRHQRRQSCAKKLECSTIPEGSQDADQINVQAEPRQHPSEPKAVTINVQTNNIQTNILVIGEPHPTAFGWPQKWPPLAATPRPFRPASFTIPLELLRQSMETTAEDAEACRQGEPGAVSKLLMEVIKRIHAAPAERNIYLNPRRADQVLVYIPERWEVLPLLDGIRYMLEHVVGEIGETLPQASACMQSLAAGVRAGYQTQKEEVVRSASGAMCAHLENLRVAPFGGADCWLGAPGGDEPPPRMFCGERFGHVPAAAVAVALEDLAVPPGELTTGAARAALAVVAKMGLAGHPENLTVMYISDATVLVHTPSGWKEQSAGAAAAEQAATLARVSVNYIRAGGSPQLAALATYIEANIAEISAEEGRRQEIIARYSRAAERYYAQTTGPDFRTVRDRLEQRREQRRALA